ncbi:MAG TPA: hypothetical protein VGU43_06315 [Thermoplasmata archaeon]|nr:hypothetical protein [Thermoplasmata archaeon]
MDRRGSRSRRASERETSPAAPDPEAERQARRTRGREELFDVRADRRSPFPALEVRNPGHGTRYEVFWPTYPLSEPLFCDCADFAHRGLGTCKHIEAARLWAAEHESELAAPFPLRAPPVSWGELDRASSALERGHGVTPQRLRWAEATLLR